MVFLRFDPFSRFDIIGLSPDAQEDEPGIKQAAENGKHRLFQKYRIIMIQEILGLISYPVYMIYVTVFFRNRSINLMFFSYHLLTIEKSAVIFLIKGTI